MQVSFSGLYLGVEVGPESLDNFWIKATKKFLDRARTWGGAGLGLQLSTLAYGVYVFPILSYLAQFLAPDEQALRAEEKALRLMAPGPFDWCEKRDFQFLKEHLGQARSFPDLQCMGLSARCRMLVFENISRGGLHLGSRRASLERFMADSDQCLKRQRRWAAWLRMGIVQSMANCRTELGLRNLSIESLKLKAAGCSEGETLEGDNNYKKMRRDFQRTVRSELSKLIPYEPIERIRHKLDRWSLCGMPGRTAKNTLVVLRELRKRVPPRVSAALLRSMFNGWCTERRFQRHGPCVFQCNEFCQEDIIEHYASCPVCVQFLRSRINYSDPIDRGHLVVAGAHQGELRTEHHTKLAVWNFVVYSAFNTLRCMSAETRSRTRAKDVLEQHYKETLGKDEPWLDEDP